eukprot:TRINITY_DN7074_c0_g1_i1.p2 TRINITY_DN7074_c0_g1~~TRINITY_DN7074_c0_g1_i1.p2  ORF type:complete len:256 (+),score=84.84 TRINITY_DN7074_c0_g1_i1:88-768(+)
MSGPVVLIVGAGNIGGELARQLKARGGARVLTAGRSAGDVRLDITDLDSVRGLDAQLPDGVDHVVCCCGASKFGPLAGFDCASWEANCMGKFVAVSRLAVMLANGKELAALRPGGSITITTGQAARVVNKLWPGIAANNAALDAFVRCSGVDAPRGVRINAVAPALVTETAAKSGNPTEGTVPAAECAAQYLPLIFGDATGQVVDAGVQKVFVKSHHAPSPAAAAS